MRETTGFAVFQWFPEERLAAQQDLDAFFASEWTTAVTAKGGTSPRFVEAIEAGPDAMAMNDITPQPGCRLFRLYGHAVPPEGVEVDHNEPT